MIKKQKCMRMFKDALILTGKAIVVMAVGFIFVLAYAGFILGNGWGVPNNTGIYSDVALLLGLVVGIRAVR